MLSRIIVAEKGEGFTNIYFRIHYEGKFLIRPLDLTMVIVDGLSSFLMFATDAIIVELYSAIVIMRT